MIITIPGLSNPLDGDTPVIVIGANGSGKTRLAKAIAKCNDAQYIPAIRNPSLSDSFPNWEVSVAVKEIERREIGHAEKSWDVIHDVDALFAKLWSEHVSQAVLSYNEQLSGAQQELIITDFAKIVGLWRKLFPGRSLSITERSPAISSDFFEGSEYPAKLLSEGERTGLYLAAKVIGSRKSIVIIDEPEVHFHSSLACNFWDEIEAICSDKRFVYVTHDLVFARSRRDADTIMVRAGRPLELISSGLSLPAEDLAAILGAASFSVYAKRIVFCEGNERNSADQILLKAWFTDKNTVLVPVGSCENVKRCAEAFGSTPVVSGLEAIGIMDRDHWPDDRLPKSARMHVLAVHEIESLYVLKDVYAAIAIHLGTKEHEIDEKYSQLLHSWQQHNKGTQSDKLILERFKAEAAIMLEKSFLLENDAVKRDAVRASLTKNISNCALMLNPGTIWDTQAKIIDDALESDDYLHFLKVLPGKSLVWLAAQSIGVQKERYYELVAEALTSKSPHLFHLGAKLELALSKHLPPRIWSEPSV